MGIVAINFNWITYLQYIQFQDIGTKSSLDLTAKIITLPVIECYILFK